MKKSLVIVESPSKAKTINKFLGDGFIVKASVGHIRDLPPKEIGIDVDNKFTPQYVPIERQKKVIKELKAAAKTSEAIYIATDPDREGEAIAWHIAHELKGFKGNIYRSLFNEITEKAVKKAIDDPLEIDIQKVDAQQARRVLDRLVGFKVSPLLWQTLYRGSLSAGRVQSVALKLICEREEEHVSFKPVEYWNIHVDLTNDQKAKLHAKLNKYKNVKVDIKNEKESKEIIANFENSDFSIESIKKKEVKRNPYAPFITSTLQMEAANKINFAPSKTMKIAQQLYEGIVLGAEGSTSLITYMRTDSNRMSDDALTELRGYIKNTYGEEYLVDKIRTFPKKKKGGGNIQDAHECIRPTYFTSPPGEILDYLDKDQAKLYALIWNRAVASQMSNAIFNQTSVKILSGDCEFAANGSEQVFPGYLKLWQDVKGIDDKSDENVVIPPGLEPKMKLELDKTDPTQHFTKPPPRFNDSSLVKELDNLGIGRPSTYAQIIFTLVDRKYITREKRILIPTELGKVVKSIVIKEFPDIFNVEFTANMEEELDSIEAGEKKYFDVIDGFYSPFNKRLESASTLR